MNHYYKLNNDQTLLIPSQKLIPCPETPVQQLVCDVQESDQCLLHKICQVKGTRGYNVTDNILRNHLQYEKTLTLNCHRFLLP